MYKIVFFVPTTHLEKVKTAMFNQGAGRANNYNQCAWQILGEGQFFAFDQAKPYLGKNDELTKVPEYYVEMFCAPDIIQDVISALKKTHPYEEPAYQVIKIEPF
jgi:structural toxin protein (hemagglutinin/hemolysin) RtxA